MVVHCRDQRAGKALLDAFGAGLAKHDAEEGGGIEDIETLACFLSHVMPRRDVPRSTRPIQDHLSARTHASAPARAEAPSGQGGYAPRRPAFRTVRYRHFEGQGSVGSPRAK